MSKEFSVNNLFPEASDTPVGNGTIDVNLIADMTRQRDTNFNVNPLYKSIIEKNLRLIKSYNDNFSQCCELIYKANDEDKTDIVFQIPFFITDVPEYDPVISLKIIQKRLWKQNINSVIMSKIAIYITWKHLEKDLFSPKKVNKKNYKYTY